jgi:ATP-dependent exoDNAse (exonuclease V) beta subunit
MTPKLQEVLTQIQQATDTFPKQKAIYKACPYSVTKICDALHKPFDKEGVAKKQFIEHFDDPSSKYYHMTVEEIIAQWEEKGKFGRENGKALDKFIGMILEKDESQEVLDKYTSSLNEVAGNKCKQWQKFYLSNIKGKIEFVGRELMLHSEKLGVNGRLDALFLKGDTLLLIDWKNNDKISTENSYEKCKGPLYEYDASDLNIYTVQVYIYVYILRNVYHLDNIKIVPLITRIGQDDFGLYSPVIPYSDRLVEDIISFAKKEINKKIESTQ